MEDTMYGKLLGFVAAAALLALASAANAQDPVKLTSGQLDRVTAGAANNALPVAASFLANGAGGGNRGGGGVNQFSPSTATVTQTIIPTQLNLFTVH
jgi:hypothetical protein